MRNLRLRRVGQRRGRQDDDLPEHRNPSGGTIVAKGPPAQCRPAMDEDDAIGAGVGAHIHGAGSKRPAVAGGPKAPIEVGKK
jgi:hypothetical protein